MSTPSSGRPNSPLTTRMYKLEYPRSLGVYSTYAEVQEVVDRLADAQFPVQDTMIVGTDLKLMERVTGRQTWGRVILGGVLGGVWMGLFIGVLFALFTSQFLATIVSSILMGIVFFTIWSVIGYALSGGKRDFTSMVATIPMQYELLVEHRHADEARRLLAEAGAPQAPTGSVGGSAGAAPVPAGERPATGRPSFGQPAPEQQHPSPQAGRPHPAQEAPVQDAPVQDAPGRDPGDQAPPRHRE